MEGKKESMGGVDFCATATIRRATWHSTRNAEAEGGGSQEQDSAGAEECRYVQ